MKVSTKLMLVSLLAIFTLNVAYGQFLQLPQNLIDHDANFGVLWSDYIALGECFLLDQAALEAMAVNGVVTLSNFNSQDDIEPPYNNVDYFVVQELVIGG